MHIKDVLAIKGRRIETVWPSQAARTIPRTFIDRNINSVVVVWNDGLPIGIVTDRDVLTAMAKHEGTLGALTARDVMMSPPPTCSPHDGVVDILRRMTEERVRHIVVMDQGKMIGLVSIGDLVKHRFQDNDLEMRVLRDLAYAHMTAAPAPPTTSP